MASKPVSIYSKSVSFPPHPNSTELVETKIDIETHSLDSVIQSIDKLATCIDSLTQVVKEKREPSFRKEFMEFYGAYYNPLLVFATYMNLFVSKGVLLAMSLLAHFTAYGLAFYETLVATRRSCRRQNCAYMCSVIAVAWLALMTFALVIRGVQEYKSRPVVLAS